MQIWTVELSDSHLGPLNSSQQMYTAAGKIFIHTKSGQQQVFKKIHFFISVLCSTTLQEVTPYYTQLSPFKKKKYTQKLQGNSSVRENCL
jgi:hypothetical protein